MKQIKNVKGMDDIVPSRSPIWQYVESTLSELAQRYGYNEIRFPTLEQTELFKRSIGEVTDIVEKEMYTFDDRKGLSLTLRPEGTACCVRAAEQRGLLYNQTQKLWYMGPMYRYERPQKGRLRQFHQFGLEAFGMAGPDVDAELLMLTARIWREFGLLEHVSLQLNNLGTSDVRARYKEDLIEFLSGVKEQLDPDSQRRLDTNPMRILDSKSETTQALLEGAPNLHDYLSDESRAHFEELRSLLDLSGVQYEVNPRLVRGLDYYSDTVFEWVTTKLGAQGTVCGGGRYDGLVEQLGGRATPAIGFGLGIERLVLMLEELDLVPQEIFENVDIYVMSTGATRAKVLELAEKIRSELPHLRLLTQMGSASFKSQMKKADASGAQVALILGESELEKSEIGVKHLRSGADQDQVSMDTLIQELKKIL